MRDWPVLSRITTLARSPFVRPLVVDEFTGLLPLTGPVVVGDFTVRTGSFVTLPPRPGPSMSFGKLAKASSIVEVRSFTVALVRPGPVVFGVEVKVVPAYSGPESVLVFELVLPL